MGDLHEPEVARVGLNESEASERGIACEVTTYGMTISPRHRRERGARPVKCHRAGRTPSSRDHLGEHAGELIVEFVPAMRHGMA